VAITGVSSHIAPDRGEFDALGRVTRSSVPIVAADVTTRPVGPAELADLADLFGATRNTRHCWCTAFCSTRTQLALGWFGDGNRRRFAALAAGPVPMGVLASVDDEPVGWAACGPRSRYLAATDPTYPLTTAMERREDDLVWLTPCLFVRPGHRGTGITYALVRAAVALAGEHGAVAIEGWPVAGPDPRPGEDFVGREKVFTDLGFRCVDRPDPTRMIMRRDL
jgi:GNAT superfamily N-acetyltransferase